MRIAFCGAGGTGKGTLSIELANAFTQASECNHTLLLSHNKYITQLMFPEASNYKDMSPYEYVIKQFAITVAQMDQELMAGNFISERSVIDYLAYLDEEWLSTLQNYMIDTAIIAKYQKMIYSYLESHPYDYVFYMKPDFDPDDKEDNKWKERDRDSQFKTDKKLRALLESDKLSYLNVVELTGIPSERLYKALDTVNLHDTSKLSKMSGIINFFRRKP